MSDAGARRRSILSARPAAAQCFFAIAVHSSDTSQQISFPPGSRPRAMATADVPVNVPTSTASRVPTRRASNVRSANWSGPICMRAAPPVAATVSPRIAS